MGFSSSSADRRCRPVTRRSPSSTSSSKPRCRGPVSCACSPAASTYMPCTAKGEPRSQAWLLSWRFRALSARVLSQGEGPESCSPALLEVLEFENMCLSVHVQKSTKTLFCIFKNTPAFCKLKNHPSANHPSCKSRSGSGQRLVLPASSGSVLHSLPRERPRRAGVAALQPGVAAVRGPPRYRYSAPFQTKADKE